MSLFASSIVIEINKTKRVFCENMICFIVATKVKYTKFIAILEQVNTKISHLYVLCNFCFLFFEDHYVQDHECVCICNPATMFMRCLTCPTKFQVIRQFHCVSVQHLCSWMSKQQDSSPISSVQRSLSCSLFEKNAWLCTRDFNTFHHHFDQNKWFAITWYIKWTLSGFVQDSFDERIVAIAQCKRICFACC